MILQVGGYLYISQVFQYQIILIIFLFSLWGFIRLKEFAFILFLFRLVFDFLVIKYIFMNVAQFDSFDVAKFDWVDAIIFKLVLMVSFEKMLNLKFKAALHWE